MRVPFTVFVFLAALLSADVGSAAEGQAPWHVKEAEIRIPVTVSIDPGRHIPDGDPRAMPPQVYLADLKPVESTGLSFDPESKGADKAKGSATFALKPEYKWFSFRAQGAVKVFVDGKNIFTSDRAMEEYTQSRGPTIQTVVVPPDAKTLRIEAAADYVRQAGFITRGPAVAQADFCLPGLDPTSLIPLVYTLSGERVGCRVLWAHPTEPMHILLDCSSGETQYLVYLVDRSKEVPRLDWTPQAGLIREARYLDYYDPAVTTLEGFQKLWDRADFIAEKSTQNEIFASFLPFRPFHGDTPNYHDTPRWAPLELCRYTGFFHLPDTREYNFSFKARSGGYLLFDNQMVAQDAEGETEHGKPKSFKLKLEKGLHRLDCHQYGRDTRFYATLLWDLPGDQVWFGPDPRPGDPGRKRGVFGSQYFSAWEALAEATAGPPAHREKELFASFTWDYASPSKGKWPSQWWGKYPATDVIQLSLAAALSQKREGAVFRWRFDDGHLTEGRKINHHFFMPGTRKVELDVLDGPGGKVIAHAAGDIHVHMDWAWPGDAGPEGLQGAIAERMEEFATVTPIAEVVSVYYWSLQHGWMENRTASGAALAKRLDEVLEKYPYTRLLELAQTMAEPVERHYDAAEKLCRTVMDRAPVGSCEWKSAATTLADILVSVRAKPKEGLALLAKAEKTKPILDMTGGWRTAEVKRQQLATPEDGEIADQLKDLDWSEGLSFTMAEENGRKIWVAKDLDLPDSRQGEDLVLDLGATPDGTMAGSGTLWFNGKRLGNSWQWPDGRIVIPAAMQRYGGKNQFLALLQPTDFSDGGKLGRGWQLQTGKVARGKESAWARRGYREVPMAWYTSASCEEKGVNYTFYVGEWDGKALSGLDKLEIVSKGAVDSIGLLPRDQNQTKLFPKNVKGFVKLTGYVKAGANVYDFSGIGWRVYMDSQKVIDKHYQKSSFYLGEGVHSVTLIHEAPSSMWGLDIALPGTFVPKTEPPTQRITAEALLLMGEDEKAREILLALKPDAWPIDEQKQLELTGDLQRCRQRAQKSTDDAAHGLEILDGWLEKHPLLRMDPDLMLTKMEVLAAAGDHASALVLAEQIARMDLGETQREQFMLVQVKAMCKAGKMDAARDVYIQLKKMAPYSGPTLEAREAITKAVLEK